MPNIIRTGGGKVTPPSPQYDASHIAVWKLDETSGTTISDSVGIYAGATTGTTIIDGWKNKARRFGGGTDRIDFISQVIPLGAKTIRFKFRKNGIPANAQVFLENNKSTTVAHGINAFINNGTGKMLFISRKNVLDQSRFTISSEFSPTDNTWYDIQFTWDGTTNANEVKLFIKALEGANAGKWRASNGTWVDAITPNATATANATETINASYNLIIGKNATDTSMSFVGDLDEIEISNIARTDMLDYE